MADQIPASVPAIGDQVSLLNLHVELRIEVWKHLILLNNVPCSYGYTGLPARAIATHTTSLFLLGTTLERTLACRDACIAGILHAASFARGTKQEETLCMQAGTIPF